MDSTFLYSCIGCELGFQSQSGLLEHQERHNMSKWYKCQKCEKKFHDRTTIQRHMFTHWRHEICRFPCVVRGCDALDFPNLFSLESHVKKVHLNRKPGNEARCKICGKCYTNSTCLLVHFNWEHKDGKTDVVEIKIESSVAKKKSLIREFIDKFVSEDDLEFIMSARNIVDENFNVIRPGIPENA